MDINAIPEKERGKFIAKVGDIVRRAHSDLNQLKNDIQLKDLAVHVHPAIRSLRSELYAGRNGSLDKLHESTRKLAEIIINPSGIKEKKETVGSQFFRMSVGAVSLPFRMAGTAVSHGVDVVCSTDLHPVCRYIASEFIAAKEAIPQEVRHAIRAPFLFVGDAIAVGLEKGGTTPENANKCAHDLGIITTAVVTGAGIYAYKNRGTKIPPEPKMRVPPVEQETPALLRIQDPVPPNLKEIPFQITKGELATEQSALRSLDVIPPTIGNIMGRTEGDMGQLAKYIYLKTDAASRNAVHFTEVKSMAYIYSFTKETGAFDVMGTGINLSSDLEKLVQDHMNVLKTKGVGPKTLNLEGYFTKSEMQSVEKMAVEKFDAQVTTSAKEVELVPGTAAVKGTITINVKDK